MGKKIDYVVGRIYDLEEDRVAGWSAYFASDDENDRLKKEVARLKKLLRRKSGRKIKR